MESVLDFFSLYQEQLFIVLIAVITVIVLVNVFMMLRINKTKKKSKDLGKELNATNSNAKTKAPIKEEPKKAVKKEEKKKKEKLGFFSKSKKSKSTQSKQEKQARSISIEEYEEEPIQKKTIRYAKVRKKTVVQKKEVPKEAPKKSKNDNLKNRRLKRKENIETRDIVYQDNNSHNYREDYLYREDSNKVNEKVYGNKEINYDYYNRNNNRKEDIISQRNTGEVKVLKRMENYLEDHPKERVNIRDFETNIDNILSKGTYDNSLKKIYDYKYIDEMEASMFIGEVISGKGIKVVQPEKGVTTFIATTKGILSVNKEALKKLNSIRLAIIATEKDKKLAKKNETVGKLGILSTVIKEDELKRIQEIERTYGKAIQIKEFRSLNVGIITLGGSLNIIQSDNTDVILRKLDEFEVRGIENRLSLEDRENIKAEIGYLLGKGSEFIIISGGIPSVNNISSMAIEEAGGDIICYKIPVFPKSILTISYIENIPIIVIPDVKAVKENKAIDIILGKIFAGEKIKESDIINIADGGLSLD